jgi:hypothetical protein
VAVAGDGSALVAWTEAATGGSIVRSAALSPTGDAAPAVTLSQLEGTNGAPAVVALPSGGYYVFWEAQGAPCAGPQCIVRRLVTADGMPKGEPGVALDEGAGVTLTTPSAAATPSGDVWLSMRRVEAAPGLCDLAPTCANPPCCAGPDVVQGVQAMRFAPGGAVDLAPTLVEIISGATLLAGQVAAGPAAQQARIVWTGQPLTSEKGVQFRCLGSLGASCSTRHVSKGGGSAQAAAAVAPHAGGSFVVAWTGLVGSSSAQHVFTRHVDAEGAPLADPRQASLGLVGTHGRPTVVLRDDGANVVVWEVHDAGTGASSVRLRILEE